ncbi:MAG: 30S ribosomal protein S8e [Candidatus Aenigmarchaeota archaeon]|nr:30S ribosomal protein S8e [Candidatus Aenigmarchaeota archaeon]MDI6722994.1 30S ribosomal protein S8e [Candidatus Aenigmarchaeota archaeon]
MTKWQLRSKRKITGGLLRRHMKKKRYQRGRDFVPVHVAETKKRKLRAKGGGEKISLLAANVANVVIGGKFQKAKIVRVIENKADSQFVRRNIITKGAIIETDAGKARVTSRPGQDGVVNAVLLQEKKR